MRWLQDRAESNTRRNAAVARRDQPWVPKLLAAVEPTILSRLTYTVLDERDEPEGSFSFVLSPWPTVDGLGRVRHRPDDVREVAVPASRWLAMLAERRVPEVLRERPPRIGDVFALMVTRRDAGSLLRPTGPVVDVTADAREAARAAFYGAVAAPLHPDAAAAHAEPEEVVVEALHEPSEWADRVRRQAGPRR